MLAQRQQKIRNMQTSANESSCQKRLALPSSLGMTARITTTPWRKTSSACRPTSWRMPRSTEWICCPAPTMKESFKSCILVDLKRPEKQPTVSPTPKTNCKPRKEGRDYSDVRRPSMQQSRWRKTSTTTSWPTSDRYLQDAWNPDGPLLLIWASNLKTLSQILTTSLRSSSSHLTKFLYSKKPLRDPQCKESSLRLRPHPLSENSLPLSLIWLMHHRLKCKQLFTY